MKAVFEQITPTPSESILVRQFSLPSFDAPYHFHPEYELTWIIRGRGQRYVGQQVQSFESGDLVWLGPNLPHCWINTPQEEDTVEALVVQFKAPLWDDTFLQKPELQAIQSLFQRRNVGWSIYGKTHEQVLPKLQELVKTQAFRRLWLWMDILNDLGLGGADLHPIDSSGYLNSFSVAETKRFHQVYQFIIQHYQENISVQDAAEVAGLSVTSFCRYFKGVTQKTFVEVLLEFRIQHACQQLRNSNKSIQEISFESGFQDVSYFNKVFKREKNRSPSTYRKESK